MKWRVRRRPWQPGPVLSHEEFGGFMAEGYVAVRGAVPAPVISACQDVIWADLHEQGVRRGAGGDAAPGAAGDPGQPDRVRTGRRAWVLRAPSASGTT